MFSLAFNLYADFVFCELACLPACQTPLQVWDPRVSGCYDFSASWEALHKLLEGEGLASTARINWGAQHLLVSYMEKVGPNTNNPTSSHALWASGPPALP